MFLAGGLGLKPARRGYRVFFVTMGELVHLLFSKKPKVQLERLREADLAIFENLMYMRWIREKLSYFYISSIILTSNKNPDQWGELIGDQGITTSILDRLLHRYEKSKELIFIRTVKIKREKSQILFDVDTILRHM
ncbi:ATP-binding protein [Exiguobacterium sp. PHA03]|uniref:ATP-binding protein n=1 Tax=Exiguobacterium sp. PHA03 TaxID=3064895 RepID=UPI0035C13057